MFQDFVYIYTDHHLSHFAITDISESNGTLVVIYGNATYYNANWRLVVSVGQILITLVRQTYVKGLINVYVAIDMERVERQSVLLVDVLCYSLSYDKNLWNEKINVDPVLT